MTQAAFDDYAQARLNEVVFVPNFEREEERLFAASLASTETLLANLGEHRNASGVALSVSAGFVETITPNAFADRHNEAHVIGMHAALLVTVADFALYAFTQRDFLPTNRYAPTPQASRRHWHRSCSAFAVAPPRHAARQQNDARQ